MDRACILSIIFHFYIFYHIRGNASTDKICGLLRSLFRSAEGFGRSPIRERRARIWPFVLCLLQRMATFTSWAIAVTISDPNAALQHDLPNSEALICLTA